MNEMLERVTAAIRSEMLRVLGAGWYNPLDEYAPDMARAAILAMREPTEAMLRATRALQKWR